MLRSTVSVARHCRYCKGMPACAGTTVSPSTPYNVYALVIVTVVALEQGDRRTP
jgi:hypothetical protein